MIQTPTTKGTEAEKQAVLLAHDHLLYENSKKSLLVRLK